MTPSQVFPTGPCPTSIMLVGEAPGENEVRQGVPFVGMAGDELSRMLHDAGIMRSACFLTNVARVRPYDNDINEFIAKAKKDITGQHVVVRDKHVLPVIRDGIEQLKQEILMCRPKVIVAFGNVAMWALTGKWGITSWRGSTLECDLDIPGLDYRPKVIPTYHPAAILRVWSWRQIAVQDLRRAKGESQSQTLTRPDYSFIIRPDFPTVMEHFRLFQTILDARKFRLAVDIETRNRHIACIGFAWSKREALCIPLMCVERPEGYWHPDEEAAIIFKLYKLLTHENIEVLGQNFIYDAQYILRWWHFIPKLSRDTMIAQHVCFSNMQKGLDFLSSMYCEHHLYWKDDGKEWDPEVGEDQLWEYNCKDCVITFEVDAAEQRNIEVMKLIEVHTFQQSLYLPVLKSMDRGLRVNDKLRGEMSMQMLEEIAKREQWMIDVLGFPVNIKSPKQMADLFYTVLKQRPIFNRKTKTTTTDEEALRKIAEREALLIPITRKVAELRSLGVFLSTFINAPKDIDGRMRCSFNIAGTETYRFSSSQNAFGSGMNLQNIPKGGEEADGLELPNIRDLFIPDPGMTFFDIDLSSADLRIVTWEADEPEMKAMLREGLDPYTEIAKEFYHDPSITKKDPRRQTFKSFAHGTHYLGTAKGLAERLGLSVADAEKTQDWYFQRFPRIKKWQDDLKDQVLKRHMVENIFGYRCYFFDRIDQSIFNQAAAWIPQSTVACLINRAYVNIDRELPQVEILLQVHDSLAGQFPSYLGNWMVNKIVEQAQIALPYSDPLIIPVGVKTSDKSWGDCG
jgi:DNA polymerase I-like protein with 3'-5' exonuclease and polymerase domains/uracil-DNA glycosylase